MMSKLEELRLLQDTYAKTWAIFMNWFTWFFGLNILAFSWVLTTKDFKSAYLGPFLCFIGMFILGSLAGTWRIWRYYRIALERAFELVERDGVESDRVVQGLFATPVTGFTCVNIALAEVLVAVLWAYVYFYPPT